MSRINQIKDEYYAGLYDYKDLEKSLKNAKTAVRDLLAELTRLQALNKKSEKVIKIVENLKSAIADTEPISKEDFDSIFEVIADYSRKERKTLNMDEVKGQFEDVSRKVNNNLHVYKAMYRAGFNEDKQDLIDKSNNLIQAVEAYLEYALCLCEQSPCLLRQVEKELVSLTVKR